MHQTTIRFGSDLWDALSAAAGAEGTSVAQYVRESAVDRLARLPGASATPPAATDRRRAAAGTVLGGAGVQDGPQLVERAVGGRDRSASHLEASAAVRAQSQLARARARALCEAAQVIREDRGSRSPWPAGGPRVAADARRRERLPRA